jgi:hypothetical protein
MTQDLNNKYADSDGVSHNDSLDVDVDVDGYGHG